MGKSLRLRLKVFLCLIQRKAMKKCTGKDSCGELKDESEFYAGSSGKLESVCKKCKYKRKRKYLSSNPKAAKKKKEADRRYEERSGRAKKRLEKYGLSEDQYKDMYLQQNGKCLVCSAEKEVLCVDHNHDTGQVRGLLCNKCNLGIGYLQDNPMNLKRAMEYLLEKGFYGSS